VKFNGNIQTPSRTNGAKVVRDLGRSPKSRLSGSSLALLVLPLALLGFWSATNALFTLTAPWQAAIAFLIVLGFLAGMSLMEKSRAQKNEVLQARLDRLIHAAESIQQSILDLEKLWKVEPPHSRRGLGDWSPRGWEDDHATNGNSTNHNGAAAHHNHNHHAETARPGRHAAGAHRITPTTKA
jgi:ABC-type nickel/cobalt efflux system permease component RcnA